MLNMETKCVCHGPIIPHTYFCNNRKILKKNLGGGGGGKEPMKNIFSPHAYSGKTYCGRCEVRGGGGRRVPNLDIRKKRH